MYARVKIDKRIIKKLCAPWCAINYINTNHINTNMPKSFKDIPGPRSLPVFGTLYKYLPLIGKSEIYNNL